ncbi:MAG TPA: hypothetical protein VIW45_04375 [Vicinamibacterales bacterium]|jgi:Flp pilus assembly pilin Flp
MQRVMAAVARLVRCDDGQDLVEYGFLAALIAIVVMAGVAAVGREINSVLWTAIVQNF